MGLRLEGLNEMRVAKQATEKAKAGPPSSAKDEN
jgi:hypothetical protein